MSGKDNVLSLILSAQTNSPLHILVPSEFVLHCVEYVEYSVG